MAMTCTICRREDRIEIDRAIVAGEPHRSIAKRTGASAPALFRHKAHVEDAMARAAEATEATPAPPEAVALVAEVEAREKAAGPDLVAQLLDLSRETREILGEARQAKDRDGALRAIARLERQSELQAKILGQIRDGQVNVAIVDPVGMLRAAAQLSEERRRALP